MGRPDAVFETDARRMGDVVVVSLTGELDMATAPAVQEAVERAQGEGPIAVDLRELTFIDSTGIRALLDIYAAGQDVAARRVQPLAHKRCESRIDLAARNACSGFFNSPESSSFSRGRTHRPGRRATGSNRGRSDPDRQLRSPRTAVVAASRYAEEEPISRESSDRTRRDP